MSLQLVDELAIIASSKVADNVRASFQHCDSKIREFSIYNNNNNNNNNSEDDQQHNNDTNKRICIAP